LSDFSEVEIVQVKNISNRCAAAGVKREAFLFPKGAQIPPTMNQSAPGEEFLTRAFDNRNEATSWPSSAASGVEVEAIPKRGRIARREGGRTVKLIGRLAIAVGDVLGIE